MIEPMEQRSESPDPAWSNPNHIRLDTTTTKSRHHVTQRKRNSEPSWRQWKAKKRKLNEQVRISELNEAEQRKLAIECDESHNTTSTNTANNNSQPHVTAGVSAGREWTLSIALPGSILTNAQSQELRAHLAGQIARAAAVFCVDEVVVFDDTSSMREADELDSFHCCVQMKTILEYLECPQYLRKPLFPLTPALRFAGLLAPMDTPHHLRATELDLPYREAVALKKPAKAGSWVSAGIARDVLVDQTLTPDTRVTLRMDLDSLDSKTVKARVIPFTTPRSERGLYWGYRVRVAREFGAVFKNSILGVEYDLTIGTSDKGKPITRVLKAIQKERPKHILVVFGGLAGLEACLENDQSIGSHVDDVSQMFDQYVNTCPGQGSRTIRTEEAVLVSLARLRPALVKYCANKMG